MRNLMHAIARLLGLQTRSSDNPVQQTQAAGPALQEPIPQAGNKLSVQDTKPHHQSKSPAQQASPKKQKPARSTTAASKGTSKKQKPVQMAQSHKQPGSSTPTRASKTRQHAK